MTTGELDDSSLPCTHYEGMVAEIQKNSRIHRRIFSMQEFKLQCREKNGDFRLKTTPF
jgi:hypothetical protein